MFELSDDGKWILDCSLFKGRNIQLVKKGNEYNDFCDLDVSDLGKYETMSVFTSPYNSSHTWVCFYNDGNMRRTFFVVQLAIEVVQDLERQIISQQVDRFKLDGPEYQEAEKELKDKNP